MFALSTVGVLPLLFFTNIMSQAFEFFPLSKHSFHKDKLITHQCNRYTITHTDLAQDLQAPEAVHQILLCLTEWHA